MNIPFHVLATAGLAGAIALASRTPSLLHVFRVGLGVLALGIAAALLTFREFPELMTLAAAGIFIYTPVYLVAACALLSRSPAPRARIGAFVTALIAVGLVGAGVNGFLVEPRSLEVNRMRIESAEVRAPLRLAIVADLQTDRIGAYERAALRRIMAEQPDMILFAGDYVDPGDGPPQPTLERSLNAMLHEEGLAAPRGVFAVRGDHEGGNWERIFAGLPVKTLEVTATVVRDDVAVTGLSLRDSFATDLVVPERPGFHIVFGHRPDFALSEDVEADLLIAGHTHGGQVRMPFVGPLVTLSKVPRAWAAGATALTGGRTLIVSRGIGMTRGYSPRVRFLCRPEIVIVDVVPREEAPTRPRAAARDHRSRRAGSRSA